MHLVNTNKILNDINNIAEKLNPSDVYETQNNISALKRLLKSNINENENWENFKIYFDNLYEGFFNKLLLDYPILNQSDMRLCAYIVMDLHTNDIADIFNISPSSVRKRKQRFLEKIDLSADIDIKEILKKYL